MELTPRLKKISDIIPKGSVVADIGTDHAYLPTYCLLNGISPRAFAMDVNQGPLDRARETVNKYGVADRVELRLSDGIAGLECGEADVIVIAGMGGLLIKSILSAHPEVLKEGTLLILQPMLAQKELREYLYTSGNSITDEYLAIEGNKVYNIMTAKAGLRYTPSEKDIIVGRNIRQNSPECFDAYKDKHTGILNKIISGYKKSSNDDTDKISSLEKELKLW